MGNLDWTLFGLYLTAIALVGLWNARASHTTRAFFVADRSIPWWAVGLSVMATQASAITFIGTTGKGYADGMRFVQFYLGLPVALVILAFTLLPVYQRAGVFTAYELLGRRFDAKTRLLSSLVFLLQRSLSLGVVVYAPSIVLSMLLGWSLPVTVGVMSAVAIAYTSVGGIKAVIWTDVVQMGLIFVGMGVCFVVMLGRLPAGSSLTDALELARLTGRTRVLDFSFDPANRYTVWSGLIGGTFLFLSYFGCDQSQVQRFLAGRSLRDNQRALLFNALLKIPVQLFVLLLGVLLFAVFHFEHPPLLFDANVVERIEASDQAQQLHELEQAHDQALTLRQNHAQALFADGETEAGSQYLEADAELNDIRASAVALARTIEPDYDDTNSVFPYFIIHNLPAGLVGLLLAAIFAAAMSSIDSELNALSTTTVVDVYRRHLRPNATDEHYLRAARLFTLLWGALAATFALFAARLGSVIEAVNIIGSYFYGSLLGVFILGFGTRRANGHGAFFGLLAGMATVALAERLAGVAWLWLNPIGCGATLGVGLAVSALTRATDGSVGRE
ncbi:MAG: SSS family transporter [Chlamydiales bacterium]